MVGQFNTDGNIAKIYILILFLVQQVLQMKKILSQKYLAKRFQHQSALFTAKIFKFGRDLHRD